MQKTKIVDKIKNEVRNNFKRAVRLRRRLHTIPEISFEEKLTSQLIVEELKKDGIKVCDSPIQTGVVALIKGTRDGNTVAIRSDMDALKLTEKTCSEYTSKHPGLCHGCGHDGHMACVLESARILHSMRDTLAGNVRVIFQPAEETGEGAHSMIDAGALGDPPPDAIMAVHSWPYLDCGVVASKPGVMTAGCDFFKITVQGKGGHSARPHEALNPLPVIFGIVTKISELTKFTKEGDPEAVVSVGMIHGGDQPNVIPQEVFIKGTVRSLSDTSRIKLLKKIKQIVSDLCEDGGTKSDIDFYSYCPPVYNHPDLYDLFKETADVFLGPEKVAEITTQSTGSEDFGYFTSIVPGLLIRLGMGESCSPLHTCEFDFSDDSLESGITILTALAMRASEKTFKIKK